MEKIKPVDFLRRLHVTFEGEDGSDFGGVRREWYHLITLEMVREEHGLFELMGKDTYAHQLAPHLSSTDTQIGAQSLVTGELADKIRQIGLAGKILAKCIADQQLSSSGFSSAVYKKLLLKPFTVEDLADVDRFFVFPADVDSFFVFPAVYTKLTGFLCSLRFTQNLLLKPFTVGNADFFVLFFFFLTARCTTLWSGSWTAMPTRKTLACTCALTSRTATATPSQ
jgi:hypothetical protein